MKLKKLKIIGSFLCVTLATAAAEANEVLLTSNQPTSISFRVVHQNKNGQPFFGPAQTLTIAQETPISLPRDHYDLVGVMILSVNGLELPASANQFNQPNQCSMTTDMVHDNGKLDIIFSAHEISCRAFGGVFG